MRLAIFAIRLLPETYLHLLQNLRMSLGVCPAPRDDKKLAPSQASCLGETPTHSRYEIGIGDNANILYRWFATYSGANTTGYTDRLMSQHMIVAIISES